MRTITLGFFAGRGDGHLEAARAGRNALGPPTGRERNVMSQRKNKRRNRIAYYPAVSVVRLVVRHIFNLHCTLVYHHFQ